MTTLVIVESELDSVTKFLKAVAVATASAGAAAPAVPVVAADDIAFICDESLTRVEQACCIEPTRDRLASDPRYWNRVAEQSCCVTPTSERRLWDSQPEWGISPIWGRQYVNEGCDPRYISMAGGGGSNSSDGGGIWIY